MKIALLIAFIFIGTTVFSQVTKADIDEAMAQFPYEKIEKIVVNNVRVYYDDGTSKLTYFSYKTATTNYEIKNNSLYVKYYVDAKKDKLQGYYIIPFDKMSSIGVRADILIIYMLE